MLATTVIRLFLRLICLWVGLLSLQRGILTGLFQDLHIVSAQLTIALSVLFLGLALLMWFLSGRLSRLIVEQDDRDTSLTWSSQAVVLSGIVLISLYTLFVDAIPVLFDYITRSILLFASGQYAYLANPSILVPGIIAVIKIGLAIFIAMNARFISARVTSVQ
jgi:hypothetical protein